MGTASVAGRRFEATASARSPQQVKNEPGGGGNPATSGARLVLRSKYLLGIVAIVALYEMVSTIIGFQYTSAISFYLDGDEITTWAATVSVVMNSVAFFIQLFVTGFVLTRYGVGTALLVMPIITFLGSAGFMGLPVLLIGSFLSVSDGGFQYSINQSAREILYTPTSKVEKYQAKAFIDMFVVRTAKAVAVVLSIAITLIFTGFENVRWLSLVVLVLLGVWIKVAYFVGQEFNRKTTGESTEKPASREAVRRAIPDTEIA